MTPLAPAAAAPAQPAAPAATAACHDTNLVPTSANASQIAAATLCLVNAQRALHGEVALRENVHLDSAAAHHSQDMVSADYFAHVSPSGETPLDRIVASHYVPDTAAYEVGENLVLGTLDLATPSAIISGWMNSSEHRTNILNASFRDTGIGVVTQVPAQYSSGQTGAVVTQEFGVVQAP